MMVLIQAHKGMLCSAKYIKSELDDHNVLEKAFTNFPEYNLVITGINSNISIIFYFQLLIYTFMIPRT